MHDTKKNNKHNLKAKILNAAKIKYQLKQKKIKVKDIARDLGISSPAVTQSIYGYSKISRVDEWLKEHGIKIQRGK